MSQPDWELVGAYINTRIRYYEAQIDKLADFASFNGAIELQAYAKVRNELRNMEKHFKYLIDEHVRLERGK